MLVSLIKLMDALKIIWRNIPARTSIRTRCLCCDDRQGLGRPVCRGFPAPTILPYR